MVIETKGVPYAEGGRARLESLELWSLKSASHALAATTP